MRKYSETIKETMVRKLTNPGGPNTIMLSKEVGIPHQTLSRWVREYGKLGVMEKKSKSSRDWSAKEKLEAVMEANNLEGQELGVYLRHNGLHGADLERWKQEILEGLKSTGRGRPKTDPEIIQLRKQEKTLRKKLRRNERALAEASALLVLQKKTELIWGAAEDEESD